MTGNETSTGPETPLRPKKRRRLFLLIALPLLGLLAVDFYWLFLAKPEGVGPAGPAVPREMFENAWSERKILLLGMGDSITAGFAMEPGYGYVDRMLDTPPDEFKNMRGICLRKVLPNIEMKNISVSGSTSPEHRQWIDTELERQPEDVFGLVVMTTGGNDLIHSYGRRPPKEGAMYGASLEEALPWIENFRNRLDEMIRRTTEKFPGGCVIFLADIYDPSDGVGDPASVFLPPWPDCLEILGRYNAILRAAADRYENVRHVPLHDAFLGHGIHSTKPWNRHHRPDDPTYWFGVNLEDPNIRGFDAIRRIFLLEIAAAARNGVFESAGNKTEM